MVMQLFPFASSSSQGSLKIKDLGRAFCDYSFAVNQQIV